MDRLLKKITGRFRIKIKKKESKFFPRTLTFKIVLSLFIFYFLFSVFSYSFAVQITNRKVTLSDSRASLVNTTYTYAWTGTLNVLRCVRILFCTTATGICTTPAGLNTTAVTKGTWAGLTAANWNLDNTVNGTLTLTNVAGEAPAANVSLGFLGVVNPLAEGTYFSRITTFSDQNCLTQVDNGNVAFSIMGAGVGISVTIAAVPPPPPPPNGGGGGGGGEPGGTGVVIFQGRAYPKAFLTLLKNNRVAATFSAENSGLFETKLTGLAGGNYSFGIFAEDTDKRKSVTIGFTVGVFEGMTTTISGIFISPTIYLTPTQVERGGNVNILGQSFPESEISIFIASNEIVKKTQTTVLGKWNYGLNTAPLQEAEHKARAMAYYKDGEQSPFSQTLPFLVVAKGAMVCKGADLNFDGKVNIIDFSILLYFWNQTDPSNRCADINFDGRVNIVDFSIMMYWWTK